jgi:hypothetical protein
MIIWHLFVPIKKRNLDFMSYIRHKLSECLNFVKLALEIKGLLELKLEPFEHNLSPTCMDAKSKRTQKQLSLTSHPH